mmetsp:Transcript_16996/g.39227  ORF Transcript_16996/g.39227 Transcript_16996/m.39227 type:complete len:801 (-) Transcript_16996:638-3040(-)
MSGAWAKGTNKAVVNAPKSGRVGGDSNGRNDNNRRGHNKTHNAEIGESSGRGGRGRARGRGGGRGRGRNNYESNNNSGGRGGRGRGRNNYDNSNNKNNRRGNQNNNASNNQRIVIKDVQLLEVTGIGDTPAQQAVKRISAKILIMARTKYLEAPVSDTNSIKLFQPHPECQWTDENRSEIINQSSMKVMELGDVSKNSNAKSKNKETAPPLEECKPLEVNEETRWKPKAMKNPPSVGNLASTIKNEEITTAEAEHKALLILNKISWTTMDRLTKQLVEETNLFENDETRKNIIKSIINKAQSEQHFGPMYAQLCSIISKEFKPFKKELLEQCQGEFETDTADKIALATKNTDGSPMDDEEVQYHSMLIRKAYVGHIKFLGELYLRDVVKLSVMTYCLDELLKDELNEENLECFVHLMTTMGEKLVGHSKKKNNKSFHWGPVIVLSKSTNISNRIKFLLQDLLELKDRGWIQRRKLETAKSIADLHKELAKEEKNQRRHSSLSISTSQSNLKRSTSLAAAAPSMDNDGFMEISRTTMKKVGSKHNIPGGIETVPSILSKPKGQKMRRAQSTPASMFTSFTIGTPSSTPIKLKNLSNNNIRTAPSLPLTIPLESRNMLSIEDCEKKTKSILKEYFVGCDTADAVLSVHEMIQVGSEGSIERGAKVVETGVLMVMEMKEENVKQLLTVLESCVKDSKIEKEAIIKGLNDPIEFLRDIQIDAPLAANHLSLIVATLIDWHAISLDFLLDTPDFFKIEGKSADFAIQVLKRRSDPSSEELSVVESLMTDDDKQKHESAKMMLDSL